MTQTEPKSTYEALRTGFAWRVPRRFNIGVACVDRQPAEATALVTPGNGGQLEEVTFGRVRELSNRLANALIGLGIQAGDRVAIVLPQRLETAVAHTAVYKLGAIAVPMSVLFGHEALLHRLADSGAAIVITDGERLERIEASARETGAIVEVADGKVAAPHWSFDDLLASAATTFEPAATTADVPALIIYTSGTTGPPKGALHGHRVLLGHQPGFQLSHDGFPRAGDRFWTPADWAWIGGLLNGLFSTWYHGRAIVAASRAGFEPAWAADVIRRAGVRNTFLPPTALKLMRASGMCLPAGTLRTVMSGGEALGEETHAWARESLGVCVNEIYGQTEANYVIGNPRRSGRSGRARWVAHTRGTRSRCRRERWSSVFPTQAALADSGLTRLEGTDEEPRFSMLETIREYASERFGKSAEADELRRHHAEYFLALAEEAEPNLIGTGSHTEWLDRLERDHDNLRQAFDRLEASGEPDRVLRLAAALWRFWDQRGYLVEGRRRLESALRRDERPTAARAKALSGAADMALTSGDVAMGRRWAEEALELHRAHRDAWGTAFSMLMVAYAIGQEGDWTRAQELYDESARRFRECGDEHYAQRATRSLAWAYYEGGELERARKQGEANLRQARATHDEYLQGVALSQLADYAVDEGRLEDATSMLKESYRILDNLNDLLYIAAAVARFASVLAHAGKTATATQVLSGSTVLMEEIGASPPWFAKNRDKTLALIHEHLDDDAFSQAWEQGRALTADEAVTIALNTLR